MKPTDKAVGRYCRQQNCIEDKARCTFLFSSGILRSPSILFFLFTGAGIERMFEPEMVPIAIGCA